MRSSDDELARGVHIVLYVISEKCQHFVRMYVQLDTWYENIDHIVLYLLLHTFIGIKLVVLCGNDDCVYALRNSTLAVLYCYLTLGIRTQVCHHFALLANLRQSTHNEMGQVKAHGHEILRLIGCIAEHHALVTGTLIVISLPIDPSVDVLTLLMYSSENTTRVTIKLVLSLGVAYTPNGIACYGLHINIYIASHLAHNDYLTCGDKRLTGYTGTFIVGQELVQYGIGYLVSNFVGMTFRHRL